MLESGSVIEDRYVIDSLIGRGGMGTVYLGHLRTLESKQVAVKVVRGRFDSEAEQEKALTHFRKEASLMAGLDHPNMVHINDFFTTSGTAYLVMDYVKGVTLDQHLRDLDDFMPLPICIGVVRQLCDVLEYFHQHDPPIVFRDLKPANIMLGPSGKPKLIDFGIARTLEPESMTASFLKGTGTHGYAPIEQYMPGSHTDTTSDIYALGATIYTLFTRKKPPAAVELVTGQGVLIPPHEINPALPPRLGLLISKMMQIQKPDRCQTIGEVRTLFDQVFHPVEAPNGPPAAVPSAPAEVSTRSCSACGFTGVTEEELFCTACGARLGGRGANQQQLHTWRPGRPAKLKLDKDKATPLRTKPLKASPTRHLEQSPVAATPKAYVPKIPPAFLSEAPRIQAVVQPKVGFLAAAPEYHPVKVIEIGAKSVTFQSTDGHKASAPLQMRLAVPLLAAGNSIVVDVRATVQKSEEISTKLWQTTARFKDLPAGLRPLLAHALEQERRGTKRFRLAFQVVSKSLPGFRSISVDLSLTGIGFLTSGPVAVGSDIELWLDLDDTPTPGESPVQRIVHARVCHCAPQIDGRYRIGASFESMTHTVAQALLAYLKRSKPQD